MAVGEWVVTMTSFTVRPITNLKNDYTFMCSRLSVGRLDLKHSSSFESTPVTSGSSTPDTSEASLKSARYIPSIAEIRVRWTNFSTYFSHIKVCENGMKLLHTFLRCYGLWRNEKLTKNPSKQLITVKFGFYTTSTYIPVTYLIASIQIFFCISLKRFFAFAILITTDNDQEVLNLCWRRPVARI